MDDKERLKRWLDSQITAKCDSQITIDGQIIKNLDSGIMKEIYITNIATAASCLGEILKIDSKYNKKYGIAFFDYKGVRFYELFNV